MSESNVIDSQKFQDEYGYVHETKMELGRGGQGVVYRTYNADIAIKLSLKDGNPLNNNNDIRQARKSFNRLKYLPLENLKISMPIALLERELVKDSSHNIAGYAMQLMADMQPFETFIFGQQKPENIKALKIASYIQNISPNNLDIQKRLAFYIATHGVKRRLKALYRCALVLHQLHSRGLFFADINPNNEFFSNDLDYDEVWLIDADNIHYDDPSKHQVDIYFPRYGAPEVVTNKAKSSIVSDCYSFAILSHLMLAQHHPFDGSAVNNDNEMNWDDDKDSESSDDFFNDIDKVETGELAWILSPNDNSNQNAIPLGFVIQEPEIFSLFKQTFEQGKFEFNLRPSMNLWVIALAKLHDRLLPCPNCHFTFASLDDEKCDLCQTSRPNYLNIDVLNQNNTKIWHFVHEVPHTNIKIPTRLVSGVDSDEGYTALLEITVLDKDLFITKKNSEWDCRIVGRNRPSSWSYTFKTQLIYENVMEIQAYSESQPDQIFRLQLSIKK